MGQTMKPHSENGKTVANGTLQLTSRERQALDQVLRGCENKEIAENLAISISLTQKILRRAFGKLKVQRRTDAALVWSRLRGSGPDK